MIKGWGLDRVARVTRVTRATRLHRLSRLDISTLMMPSWLTLVN